MIQVGSIVNVSDKTGVVLVQCIKVLGPVKKRIACIGDVIIASVKHINKSKFLKMKYSKKKRFFVGTLHRCLVIRSKEQYSRDIGIYYKFNENSIVIVNKRIVPVSNRLYGPILRELCVKYPSLGCTTKFMI